ncbi:MAG: spore cortex biosynthesis protein YabQ [Clostridia bacterium]
MGTDYLSQHLLFVFALILGVALGIFYDFLRFFRIIGLKGHIFVFFQDVLFCIISAIMFLLLLYNYSYGQVRLYAFLGVIFGFFTYYFTLGKLTFHMMKKLVAFVLPLLMALKLKIKSNLNIYIIIRLAKKGFALKNKKIIERTQEK